MAGFADFPAQHVCEPADVPTSCICLPLGAPEEPRQDCPIHGCICWDGNPENYEGAARDCPTHGEHVAPPSFEPAHIESAFGPGAAAHLRREAHQLRHEADLVRFDRASDEAWLLEQEADVLDDRAAEIEARIDSTDGATP